MWGIWYLCKCAFIYIKQFLSLSELDGLNKWKLSHGVKGKQISGESLGFSEKLSLGWSE